MSEVNLYDICTAVRRAYFEFTLQTGHEPKRGTDEFISIVAFYRWLTGIDEKPENIYQSDWDELVSAMNSNEFWIVVSANWPLISSKPDRPGKTHGAVYVSGEIMVLYEDGQKTTSVVSAVALPDSDERALYVATATVAAECVRTVVRMGSDDLHASTRPTSKDAAKAMAQHLAIMSKSPATAEHVKEEAGTLAKRVVFAHGLQ